MITFLKRLYIRIGLPTAAKWTYLYKLHLWLNRIYKIFTLKKPSVKHPRSKHLRVLILCGIGDAAWSFVLVPALMKKFKCSKIHLVVHHNGDHRAGRSLEILKRFSFVDGITLYTWPIHKPKPVGQDGYLRYTLEVGSATSEYQKVFDYNLIINPLLEQGIGFRKICDQLELDKSLIDYDIFKYYKERAEDMIGYKQICAHTKQLYVVVYFGALVDNTIQGLNRGALWKVEDWAVLLHRIHQELGCKIVLVGAPYDIEYVADFAKAYPGNYHDAFINIIGYHTMPETLAILKHAKFVIGFASGVTIMSAYMGTRTAIFWRPQHLPMLPNLPKFGFHPDFARNWVKPEYLEEKRYLDLWYTLDTPDSIYERIREAGWLEKLV